MPGTYRLRNAIYLSSNVRQGKRAETILIKEPSTTTKLAADSDWYDQEITLADARGFQLGDGICLRARTQSTAVVSYSSGRWWPVRETGSSSTGRCARTFGSRGEPTAATLFPLISGENSPAW